MRWASSNSIARGREKRYQKKKRSEKSRPDEDIISYDWSNEILYKYAMPNLEYGKGKEIIYALNKIELELAHSLVSNKALIGILKN